MLVYSQSTDETINAGYHLGKNLPKNSIVCFFGDLGAGKTTFIRGLTTGADPTRIPQVSSPTFVYLNIYKGIIPIYHFDLYRLQDVDEFLSMGFYEYFSAGGICCIEWSERIYDLLPPQCIQVTLKHISENVRQITITHPLGTRSQETP
jgi:tRNA threonylcarbamoyladenosine biosynthesis protein TsaE